MKPPREGGRERLFQLLLRSRQRSNWPWRCWTKPTRLVICCFSGSVGMPPMAMPMNSGNTCRHMEKWYCFEVHCDTHVWAEDPAWKVPGMTGKRRGRKPKLPKPTEESPAAVAASSLEVCHFPSGLAAYLSARRGQRATGVRICPPESVRKVERQAGTGFLAHDSQNSGNGGQRGQILSLQCPGDRFSLRDGLGGMPALEHRSGL